MRNEPPQPGAGRLRRNRADVVHIDVEALETLVDADEVAPKDVVVGAVETSTILQNPRTGVRFTMSKELRDRILQ